MPLRSVRGCRDSAWHMAYLVVRANYPSSLPLKGLIHRLTEKPGWSDVVSDTVNTGIYLLEPEVLQRIEPGEVCDFSHDLFQQLIEEKQPIYGCVLEGYWTDIGRFEEYRRATEDMLNGLVRIEPV